MSVHECPITMLLDSPLPERPPPRAPSPPGLLPTPPSASPLRSTSFVLRSASCFSSGAPPPPPEPLPPPPEHLSPPPKSSPSRAPPPRDPGSSSSLSLPSYHVLLTWKLPQSPIPFPTLHAFLFPKSPPCPQSLCSSSSPQLPSPKTLPIPISSLGSIPCPVWHCSRPSADRGSSDLPGNHLLPTASPPPAQASVPRPAPLFLSKASGTLMEGRPHGEERPGSRCLEGLRVPTHTQTTP